MPTSPPSHSPTSNPSLKPSPWPTFKDRYLKTDFVSLPFKTSDNGDLSCETLSKSVDKHIIPVDSCLTTLTEDPIEIISQDGDTVTFNVTQDCNSEWIATDFVGPFNELECIKSRECGVTQQFIASCLDGVTIVDLYIHGHIFSQVDGSTLVIPRVCGEIGDASSVCHFRYVLKCSPSKCERSYEVKETRLRRGF